MSSFEYVMVIVAIIMGFGITTLLKGAIDALRSESPWTPGLLHGFWIVSLLVTHVALWSVRWSGERNEDWPAMVLLAFLLAPIMLYAQSELLFPRGRGETRLNEYFIENRRPFFVLLILQSLSTALGPFVFYEGVNPMVEGGSAVGALWYSAVFIVAFLYMLRSESVRLHTIFAGTYLGLVLIGTGFLGVG